MANMNWFVFFNLKENGLKVWLNGLIFDEERNKKGNNLIWEIKVYYENIFLWRFGYLHVFVVFEY